MTYARAHLVDAENGGFYHCISRCVRRSWLCGKDALTGRSFEHRRAWIESRILELSEVFAIDLFGYAVMSNHYHLVVEVVPQRVQEWSDEEVVSRWLSVCGPRDEELRAIRTATLLLDSEKVSLLRERLGSLSWFMRFMNEPIARMANREDRCKGRFWEGRFKSIALLDEAAVVACMAYVDLNPVRAKITQQVESAPYTSVRRRTERSDPSAVLAPMSRVGLSLTEYVALLRWTVEIDSGQVSAPSRAVAGTIGKLSMTGDDWLGRVKANRFKYRAYGAIEALKRYAHQVGQRWIKTSPSSRPTAVDA